MASESPRQPPARAPPSSSPPASRLHGTLGLSILRVVCVLLLAAAGAIGAASEAKQGCSRISAGIGWTYFSAWTISFYPQVWEHVQEGDSIGRSTSSRACEWAGSTAQVVLNWQRQSVVGMSFDFVALNVLGYMCYSAFNASLFWSSQVQREYAAAHGGSRSAVEPQAAEKGGGEDVAFAIHALVLSLITLVQIAVYDRGSQSFSRPCKAALAAFVIFACVSAILLPLHALKALTFLYALSYIKLAVTLTKYLPQVFLNIRRKSTRGWNIDNILLDLTGGSLSVAQLFLDAACSHDWTKVSGDPVKFGLGFVSMLFDVIFIVQHYCIYRQRPAEATTTPKLADPLLTTETPARPVEADVETAS